MKYIGNKTAAVFMIAVFLAATYFTITDVTETVAARAEITSEYLRVVTEDTPFYADKAADEPLFYLPYTYYVRVKEYGEVFTHIEYAHGGKALDGYAPTDKLFYDGLEVDSPFPEIYAVTADTAVLYASADLSSTVQFVFGGRKLYFYGSYFSPQGKRLYFVGYNDRLGYVKEEDLVPFTLSNHPNELTFLAPEPAEEPNPDESSESTSSQTVFDIRIATIAVLALAGLIALVVAFNKKPKAAAAASYYDENDYE